jgi:hypothetical protein
MHLGDAERAGDVAALGNGPTSGYSTLAVGALQSTTRGFLGGGRKAEDRSGRAAATCLRLKSNTPQAPISGLPAMQSARSGFRGPVSSKVLFGAKANTWNPGSRTAAVTRSATIRSGVIGS